jgi:hypothetical protein
VSAMKPGQDRHVNILQARAAYERGENVTALLRRQLGVDVNTPEIIELLYDIQSGSYISKADDNPDLMSRYCKELAAQIDPFARQADLSDTPHVYALDISWSRLYVGKQYANRELGQRIRKFAPFVGEIGAIPLPDKSVQITLSNHALEPNGTNIEMLMAELFRVTSERLILFEPCYETHSPLQRERMERLGYIRDIKGVVNRLGGEVVSSHCLATHMNELNPTTCFHIRPKLGSGNTATTSPTLEQVFSVPGTSLPLSNEGEYYISYDCGLCFPVLRGIPVLRSGNSILATALAAESERSEPS